MKHIRKFIITIFITFLIVTFILLGVKYFQNEKIESKAKKEREENNLVSLTMVGDFLFESPYYRSIDAGDSVNTYFRKVKNYFLDDDISIGNMEVVIGNENLEVSGDGLTFVLPSILAI